MGLVLRLVTGSALSYPQMDNNLIYLDNKVTGSTGYLTYFSGSSSTAAAVGQSLLFQTGSKMLMTGSFNVSGAVSASFFVGDGSQLTNLPSSPSGISSLIATGSVTASVNVDNFVFSIVSESISYGHINKSTFNISFGRDTLPITNTGVGNTSLGDSSLSSSMSGSRNVAIGQNSLNKNAGDNNTAIGEGSLNNNTIGFNNVAIGRRAGTSNVSGSNNVFIGASSGANNIGSNNVFIGRFSGFNETSSDKLYIANSTTSDPLIKGDFVSGSITINNVLQITPQHPLPAAASYPNSFAVSSSTPPVPYFSNGTSWTALY